MPRYQTHAGRRRIETFTPRCRSQAEGPGDAIDHLSERHGLHVRHQIDLSYFAPLDEAAPRDNLGASVAVGDLYAPPHGFVWFAKSPANRNWKSIDLRDHTWSSLVRTLRTASLFVTGRPHGMYAACRARIPFVPVRGDSHDFEDLLESAQVDIPVAEALSEAVALVNRSAHRYQSISLDPDKCEATPYDQRCL